MSGTYDAAWMRQQYSYSGNSNLVLMPDRRGRERNAPTGEPEPLKPEQVARGFGSRVQFSKPDLKEITGSLKKKKRQTSSGNAVQAQRPGKLSRPDRAGGILAAFNSALFDPTMYRPKTEETRVFFEQLLSFVQARLGDQPQEVIMSAANEVLAILKDEKFKDSQRKQEVDELLGTDLSPTDLNRLVNLGKGITDYSPGEDNDAIGGGFGGAASASRDQIDDEIGVGVVFPGEDDEYDGEADDEDEALDEIPDDEEIDEGEDALGADASELNASRRDDGTEEDASMTDAIKIDVSALGDDAMMVDAEARKDAVDAREIDAYWLQRELAKFIKDATEAHKTAERVFQVLVDRNTPLSECENSLVEILDYDKFDLIKKLLRNRFKIAFCTRLQRAKDESTRQAIRDELRNDPELRSILDELEGKISATRASAASASVAADRGKLHTKQSQKPSDVNDASSRTLLDLEALTFENAGHTMTNKQCILREKSFRRQMKGYEEVHIPAIKNPPMAKDERIIPISELPEYAQAAFKGMPSLNRVQSAVYQRAMFSQDNLLLCAPTGAGKTNVAMLCVLNVMGQFRKDHDDDNNSSSIDISAFKIVYIAPMKALVQEMVENFQRRLSSYGIKVHELTGDMQMTKQQIDETQIIVTTPEKWDIVTRKSGDRVYTQLVKLVIIDEIHLLHDDRGPVLESIIARTIRHSESTQEMVRIVGLSATLPNFLDIALLLRIKEEDARQTYFDNSYRPVPLQQQYIGITEKKPLKRFQLMNAITYEKVMEQAGKNQILIFVHSRKETAKTARALRDMAIEREAIGQFLRSDSGSRAILQDEMENVKSADLKDLLPYGFGIHHAGMLRSDRTRVEDLFADGHIQVLVSTATLAWGVNLPAHTVIIKGTQIYNPERGRWTELSALDVNQMMGRAGRPQFDTFGEGIIITTHQELQFYLSLLNQQLPIESQLISRLPDQLNAEIVLGTVQNLRDAVTWLGYTYLFVRMAKNPTIYGISESELETDPRLERRRADLIHSAAVLLDKTNLIKYDRRSGSFQVTDLGRVASHYYVTCRSIATYNEHLKQTMSNIDIMRLFSLSGEFRNITVRSEEKLELQKLLERVPIPIKETIEDPSAKVNVLLQAYISGLKLEGFALVADMVYITQSAGRLMRALLEIVMRRGWAQLANRMLDLCKMVDRRMWKSQSPLRQFKGIPDDITRRIEKKDLSWERFYHLSPSELGELIRFPQMGKDIYRAVHRFPRLELAAQVQPITRSILRIDLTITPDFQFVEKLHGNAELFWIFVEDVDGEVLLHHEPFVLKAKYAEEEHYVSFTVPIFEPLPPQYFVRVTSDRWLGSEKVLSISFRHLILPEKYPAHTELLDLQPLTPAQAFHNQPAHLALFAQSQITKFNPIQTQTFHALYELNDNVLVAAPTGSGKTLCAEFAILGMFNRFQEGSRCVYIGPLQSIAEQRFRDWSERFGKGLGKTVVMLSGDQASDLKLVERAHIVVSSPENWDIISRRWNSRKSVQQVKLFIVDELHLIGGEKGPVIEIITSRMRSIAAQPGNSLRVVGLSTSLANAKDVAEWIGATSHSTFFNFHPNVRPVPLEIHIQGFDQYNFSARMIAMTKPTFQVIKNHASTKPVIVFTSARKYTRQISLEIITFCAGDDEPRRFLHAEESDIAPFIEHTKGDQALGHCIEYGVAYIYEGQPETERAVAEQLFQSGAVQVLIAEYSLSWSMEQLAAHVVIIMGTQFYDGREHRYMDYPIADMLQMMGRASRPLTDDNGKCFIFTQSGPKKDHYKRFLFDAFPVESHLDHYFADHLNAEIASKTVETKQEAVDYLTWTFLYRRLRLNPNYYNLHGNTHRHLSDWLSELVENTLTELEQGRCIAIEGNQVSPLNLGMIASYYYTRYTTLELFNDALTENTKLRSLIDIVSSATEFVEQLPVRHHEEDQLRRIAMHLPIKIEKPKFSDPHVKANILLQAHLSRRRLPQELNQDRQLIVQKMVILLQAIVDVISSNGWLNPALAAMELSQAVVQAVWDRDSPLLQLPHFSSELVQRCNAAKVETIDDIVEIDDDKRVNLLQMSDQQLRDVAQVCNRFPSISVRHSLASESVVGGSQMTLAVQLDRELDEDEQLGPVHAPYFPGVREEAWWLVIGEPSKNRLHAIKRISLNRTSKTKLAFPAPSEAGNHKFTLFLMSDSWTGCDQEFEVRFRVEPEEEDDGGAGGSDSEMPDAE